MIPIKTEKQIAIMARGGAILSGVLAAVVSRATPGVSELELDALAQQLIREWGAEPGFKKVPGYHHAVCVSTNDVVVHGIPTSYKLKDDDVIGIDCGVYLEGFHTDMSETVRVSKIKNQNAKVKRNEEKVDKFLEIGKRALREAIQVAIAGNRVGHISQVIQKVVEKESGYSVVRSLIGHGVGRDLHEEPEVPGYLASPLTKTPQLKTGMTIAVEVIYNMGGADVVYANRDGWTIKTKDSSISGVFERTIAITEGKPVFLTPDI